MRWVVRLSPTITVAIALYFAMSLGLEALQALTSPTRGLDDRAVAGVVFGFGRLAGLGPEGLVRTAVLLGAVKLTAALVFPAYLAERRRGLFGVRTDHETLEAGLLLVVAATIVMAMPALYEGRTELLRQPMLYFLLAAAAAVVTIAEQLDARVGDDARGSARATLRSIDLGRAGEAVSGPWFAPPHCRAGSLRLSGLLTFFA